MAVVGLGGYAGSMADFLLKFTAHVNSGVAFVAACDPNVAQHPELVARLRERGVTVLDRFEDVLNQPIDAVWLPLPIQLHRPFTELALAAGKAVLCEKPAAGSVQDLDAMVAASARADRPVAIGFQNSYEPAVLQIKRRLLDGAIGQITGAALMACWPRNNAYYARSPWAGRIELNGTWVLDSPANNALAHPLNLALYFMGDRAHEWAVPLSIEAELYRVNPIQNYDTCSLRVATAKGPLLTQFTHACRAQINPVLHVEGTDGRATVPLFGAATIVTSRGTETIERSADTHGDMIRNFSHWAQGLPTDCSIPTLAAARAHTTVINGASQATPVFDLPATAVQRNDEATGGPLLHVPGIEEALVATAGAAQMLHESGRVSWSQPPGMLSLVDYREFTGPPRQ
jgi:predicted dehydrogenase